MNAASKPRWGKLSVSLVVGGGIGELCRMDEATVAKKMKLKATYNDVRVMGSILPTVRGPANGWYAINLSSPL